MAGRLVDYIGHGLLSALPSAATIDAALTSGAAGFYYAYDISQLYSLNRNGTPAWEPIGGWGLEVGSYDYSVDGTVASVDVTDLGAFSEFLIIGKGLTTSASVNIRAYLSVNNGASFYSSSGDYQSVVPTDGTDGGASSGIAFSGTNTTSGKNISFRIWGNKTGLVFGVNELIDLATQAARRFDASSSDVNAIQIAPTSGNITGGSFKLLAR